MGCPLIGSDPCGLSIWRGGRRDCLEAWGEVVMEGLMDRILWDEDWARPYVQPDDPRNKAEAIKEFLGIDPDYYAAVAPDPNPQQLARIRESLERLRTMAADR